MAVTTVPVGSVAKPGTHDLMVLRSMTFRFGVLHEVQVLNLRVWPRIYLGEAARVQEIRYEHETRTLELDIGSAEVKNINLSGGAENLDRACKYLLGTDVRVRVVAGGQAIYDGQPRDDKWLSSTSVQKKQPSSKRGKKKAGRSPASRRR